MTSTGKTAEAEAAYIDAAKTLRQAGHLMRELGVGALRVRGENGNVQGTISADMVVRRIAAGDDPKTVTVGEVAAVPPYVPGRRDTGAGRGEQRPDPRDDQVNRDGAPPDRGWHGVAPDAQDAAVAGRKLPGLVALPVTAAGTPVPTAAGFPRMTPLAWAYAAVAV